MRHASWLFRRLFRSLYLFSGRIRMNISLVFRCQPLRTYSIENIDDVSFRF